MTPAHHHRSETETHAVPAQRPREAVVIESAQLFTGKKEVQIRHEGQLYRLRVTKNGKLILNK